MPEYPNTKEALPGRIAVGLIVVTACLWTFWGTAEMYFEGWGQPFPAPLAYLIPAAISLLLALAAIRFPRIGGWAMIALGGLFTVWWVRLQLGRGADFAALLTLFPVSAMIVVTGVLFLLDSRYQCRLRAEGAPTSPVWWRRNIRYVITVGAVLLTIIAISVVNLPIVLTRDDDGYRGQRVIEGNGITIVWAPSGPGWNWKQDFGGYPSWNSLALYGMEPVGIDWHGKQPGDSLDATPEQMHEFCVCAYLSEDGSTLVDTPLYIWRMPTTDEVVRSLCRDGRNAGCVWDGTDHSPECVVLADKETPLWNPTEQPVYYWTAEQLNEKRAYFVSYNGRGVGAQPKRWGNPRHGYRCVRNVKPGEVWDSLGILIDTTTIVADSGVTTP